MLAKTIKYNFKSTYKIILLLNLYMVITTFVGISSLRAGVWNTNSSGMTGLGAVLFIVYMLSVAFITYVVNIYIAVRFYRNMYSDEAYLIHTLPVSKKDLLVSQTIVGAFHTLITSLIMLVCIFGLMFFLFTCLNPQTQAALSLTYDPEMMTEIKEVFSVNPVMKIITIILCLIFSSVYGILLAFAAVSMGQLFTRHKIAAAIACYIGLYTIMSIASSIVLIPFMGLSLLGQVTMTQLLNCGILVETIFSLVCCAVFHLLCYYLLSKKLNLD